MVASQSNVIIVVLVFLVIIRFFFWSSFSRSSLPLGWEYKGEGK